MFVLCPHCQFLVTVDPASGVPPARCPRCRGLVNPAVAPAIRSSTDPAATAARVPAAVAATDADTIAPAKRRGPTPKLRGTAPAGTAATPAVTTAPEDVFAPESVANAADVPDAAAAPPPTPAPAPAPKDADVALVTATAGHGADEPIAPLEPLEPLATAAPGDVGDAQGATQAETGVGAPAASATAADEAGAATATDDAVQAQAPDAASPSTPAEPGAVGDSAPPPAPAPAPAPPGWPQPRRWHAPAAIGALAVLLVLQMLLADRARLAADAHWRPAMQRLCSVLRCRLPPWHAPEAFTLLDRNVAADPRRPGVLQAQARFRNDAPWAQAWPTLLLTLSDADGRVVGARAFTPREYLARGATQNEVASGQVVAVSLAVVEPAPGVVAFTFEFR